MALEDGRERFKRAVEILVDENERVKDRLLIAYASQLSLLDAKQDLPPELLDDFYALRNALSNAEMPYGSGERAAKKIQALSEDEASAWARNIFSLFLELIGAESMPSVS